jgi:hypothetical protein
LTEGTGKSEAAIRFTGWNFLDVDELADTTDASPVGQWVKGVGLAGLVAAYAVDCLVTQHAIFPARYRGFAAYDGLGGTALGLVYLSIALFLHSHCFWSASPRFWGYAQLGKLIAAAGVIGGTGLFFYAAL